jgi:hypothetical protein
MTCADFTCVLDIDQWPLSLKLRSTRDRVRAGHAGIHGRVRNGPGVHNLLPVLAVPERNAGSVVWIDRLIDCFCRAIHGGRMSRS